MKNRVALLLCLTLMTSSLIPLIASFLMIKETFQTQEQIYRNAKLEKVLVEAQDHVRDLSNLDPAGKNSYRAFFEKIEDLKLIYGSDDYFSERLTTTLSKYFFIEFGAALAVSLALGILLSTYIHRSYKKSQLLMLQESERARNLEEIARWQEVAKKLAHEIKRPLQPISTWNHNLRFAFGNNNQLEFESIFKEATQAIDEEVRGLTNMVSEFARFADLPKARPEEVNMQNFLQTFVDQYASVWPQITFKIVAPEKAICCCLDPLLFRNCLTNLIENAAEANPQASIEVQFIVRSTSAGVALEVFNSGHAIKKDHLKKLFTPYSTTKNNQKNLGLGLSIVKLSILEQGGEIHCLPEDRGVRFQILMPMNQGVQDVSQ
jgi:signal transduction histidine kinase